MCNNYAVEKIEGNLVHLSPLEGEGDIFPDKNFLPPVKEGDILTKRGDCFFVNEELREKRLAILTVRMNRLFEKSKK